MEERQTNYTIGEGFTLPSEGKIYGAPINAHVELRSMTARDEMKRVNPSSTPLKNLADIIEGCLIEKPAIHVYDMCLGDYEFLLHKLRIVTYGDTYKVNVKCPFCGEYIEADANLSMLELKEFDLEEFNKLREFTLKSGDKINIKFMTPRMMETIESREKELKRKFKNSDLDFNTYARVTTLIDSINDNKLNQFEVESYVDRMSAADLIKILNNSDKLNSMIGLDNEMIVPCKSCGNDVSTFFRFGAEFFRPSNND